MKLEGKIESYLIISQLSKYKFVIEWALKPAIEFVPYAEESTKSTTKHFIP